MTIAEILNDEALRRHEFPVVQHKTFLAHAGVCPLPRRVSEAMRHYVAACEAGDQEEALPAGLLSGTRNLAARLLGADPKEIALVGPTSLALSFVAAGLSLPRRANVLVYFDDYPSNVYPWMALAPRGVEVRRLRTERLGEIRAEEVLDQIDGRTALVALASCHFVAGWRIDIESIGAALRERGIHFCVDGIQTVGAFPTPVASVDFLAADAHKWLLGPCSAGLFFVRQTAQAKLAPVAYGWFNVECPDFVAQPTLELKRDARRYEAGSGNLVGVAGLRAALELLLELGVADIARELLRKRAWFVPALEEKGFEVLHAGAPTAHAGAIVSVRKPGADMAAIHDRLQRAKVFASLRADRAGQRYVRFSPHCYNTDAELGRVLELL